MGWVIGHGNSFIFRQGGGQKWQTYWTTLISATVENAAPTNVVLTFPSAKPALGASDFTIAGFTISSASWTGAVLTLVLSRPVLIYYGNLTITFVTTGQTATVINNVMDDGDTVAWYDFTDSSSITKDAETNEVSLCKDRLGSNRDLVQNGANKKPIFSTEGITTDGVNDFMNATFTLNQPVFIFIVFRNNVALYNQFVFDGRDVGKCYMFQAAVSHVFRVSADTAKYSDNGATKLAVGDTGVARVLFNGANSRFKIDLTAVITDFGVGDMGGFCIGARGDGLKHWGNYTYKEIIIKKAAPALDIENDIYKHLRSKHNIGGLTFDKGKVLFTFDDNEPNIATYGVPLFASRGIVGTIYIPSDWMGWPFVKVCYDAGWEAGNHGKTHTSFTALSEAELRSEIETSQAGFVTNGMTAPTSVAYPAGAYDDNVLDIIADYFDYARAFSSITFGYKNDNKLEIIGIPTDNKYFTLATLLEWIDMAEFLKVAVVFTFHDIDATNSSQPNNIGLADLTTVIDYALTKDVDILTISQLGALMT